MLTAVPAGWPSTIFIIYEDNGEIGRLNIKASSSDLILQGRPYKLQRRGMIKGDYSLESAEGVIARAKHAGMFSSVIVIEYGNHEYSLKPGGVFSGGFSLSEGSTRIGHFSQEGREFTADLSRDIPLPVRIFILWLMLQISMAAAASG